ncbi:MAG: hypothetical protein Q8O92_06035 [Candidatus Latescibacter sp.]|nr:hypothetical protein [Candidatus Latescibacter sp.]
MSDLRIGLIAEGETDFIIIQAALKSVLGRRFIIQLLQPESIGNLGGFSETGGGWGGVYRKCREFVSMEFEISKNPSLSGFNLILIHIDADVAGESYPNAGIEDQPNQDLPCEKPCPPAEDTVQALRSVVMGWLNLVPVAIPKHWALCIPSKSIETWLIVALYGQNEPLFMQNIECNKRLEEWLTQRPVHERLVRMKDGKAKKIKSRYLKAVPVVTERWSEVEQRCTQAVRFRIEVLKAVNTTL